MEINNRLDILKSAGQISEVTYDQVERVIRHFQDNHQIVINEENGAMLITHLCIALSRIEKGEKINEIDEESFKDVRKNIHFKKAEDVLKDIETILGREMPIEERGYMMMHLCVLFGTVERE